VRFCSSCGHENRDEARFCDACGARLAEVPPERFRKLVTVLFTDVVSSTELGERLDPETYSSVMSSYFEALRPVVERSNGRVEKFIGDAVVAVFGLPVTHEDDALRAVKVALQIRHGLDSLNANLDHRFGVTIATRTGLNTGVVASTAREGHQELVFGDTTNVAARLQQLAAGGEILLSQTTYRLVRDAVSSELLPPLEAKGKAAPLTVHRLLGARSEVEAVSRHFDAELIGRERELEALLGAFREAVETRSCRIVTLLGEAGVGKSRLTRELEARIADEATVLRGRCLPYGEGITYWPIGEIVRQAAGIDEQDSRERAGSKLAELAGDPDLADRVAGLIGLSDAQVAAGEAPLAVRALLERIATGRPLVAVVEDLHWAEEALLAALEHVASRARDAPLCLVCLARPELIDTKPAWAPLVTLAPLSGDEASRLVEALLEDTALSEELRPRIARAAGGNPLFLEQMVSMLLDEGVPAPDDASELVVPPSIHALLAARIDLLPAEERAVLGCAAVIGQLFYGRALEELLPEPDRDRLQAALDSLVRRQLVQPDRSDLRGEDAFSFRHLLIRDVAYDRLTKEDRSDLHERFAAWLGHAAGERASEVAEILGYHLEQAFGYLAELRPLDEHGRLLGARAADRLTEAARRAAGRGDSAAFATLLGRAVSLVEPSDPRRPALLVELAGALRECSRFEQARSTASEALGQASDPQTEMRARLSLLQIEERVDPTIDYRRVEDEATRAAAFFEEAGDAAGAATAWRLLFRAAWTRRQTDAARAAAERAVAFAQRAGDPRCARDAMLALAAMSAGPTPSSAAIEWGEAKLANVRGDRGAEAGIRFHLSCLWAMRGEFERARELAVRAIEGHDELGNRVSSAADRANALAWYVERLRRDWPAAERELRRAYDELRACGETYVRSAVAAWLADCLYRQYRDAEADEFVQACVETAPEHHVGAQVFWRLARSKLSARAGRPDEAELLAREAVELADTGDGLELQAEARVTRAEVLQLGGRRDEASAVLRAALELYERKEHLVGLAAAGSLLDELETVRPAPATAD
jgi:class 3 adenylate cyclase/tetratricopeptide (TPR) repeat protein